MLSYTMRKSFEDSSIALVDETSTDSTYKSFSGSQRPFQKFVFQAKTAYIKTGNGG